jgi:hypothetical protein
MRYSLLGTRYAVLGMRYAFHKYRIPNNEYRTTSTEQRVTSNEQRVTSNEYRIPKPGSDYPTKRLIQKTKNCMRIYYLHRSSSFLHLAEAFLNTLPKVFYAAHLPKLVKVTPSANISSHKSTTTHI